MEARAWEGMLPVLKLEELRAELIHGPVKKKPLCTECGQVVRPDEEQVSYAKEGRFEVAHCYCPNVADEEDDEVEHPSDPEGVKTVKCYRCKKSIRLECAELRKTFLGKRWAHKNKAECDEARRR